MKNWYVSVLISLLSTRPNATSILAPAKLLRQTHVQGNEIKSCVENHSIPEQMLKKITSEQILECEKINRDKFTYKEKTVETREIGLQCQAYMAPDINPEVPIPAEGVLCPKESVVIVL